MGFAVVAALFVALAVANIWIAREWLGRFVEAHPDVEPGYGWITTSDSDPEVERWRRYRLVVVVAELVVVAVMLYLAATPA